MLASALTRTSGCWSVGDGLGALLAGFPELDPLVGGRASNRLIAEDARALDEHLRLGLASKFAARAGRGDTAQPPRLFDASPRNALMVPFLDVAFDEALFVYVSRDPAESLAESLAIWRAGDAVTYPQLPGWSGPAWSFPLVPGWEDLREPDLAEVVVEQWVRTVGPLLDDLEALPAERWCVTEHEVLRADPAGELERLFGFLGLPWDAAQALEARFEGPLDLRPDAEEALLDELSLYLSRTDALAARAADWIAPRTGG
jgi:hypothetical protein